MKQKFLVLAVAMLLAVSFVLAGQEKTSVVDVAISANSAGEYAGKFDTLIAAVVANPTLLKNLDSNSRVYTVFAPTDEAFAKLGIDATNVAKVAGLENILLYHVTWGKLDSKYVLKKTKIGMENGEFIKQKKGVITDNQGKEAKIIVTDVKADNGYIHVIDSVLMPKDATNGEDSFKSVVDVAIAVNSQGEFAGKFDTLIAAVVANPKLLKNLDSDGRVYTVFAPTDEAFAKLGIDATNVAKVAGLKNILLYHVTWGELDSKYVLKKTKIGMENGEFIKQKNGVITDNQGKEAKIIVTDVKADNGYIHVIDSVLMPK